MSLDSLARGSRRRRFPRIELDAPLTALDLATSHVAEILDLSHGGFRTLSPMPGRPGMRHTFRVALSDGTHCDVRAMPIHSHRAPGALHRFVVSWRSLPEPESQAGLRRLITFVTTLSSVDEEALSSATHAEEPFR